MASMPSLDLTLGAIVVSTFFSFITMGVILTITWQYYANFPQDRLVFKLLVFLVFMLSLIDTVADGYWCYDWTVLNYAQPQIMAILPVSLIVEIFCVGTTSLIVQHFFCMADIQDQPATQYYATWIHLHNVFVAMVRRYMGRHLLVVA